MKVTLTNDLFRNLFKMYGKDNEFSVSGLEALYMFLEESERNGKEEIDIDIDSLFLRCKEYKSLEEALNTDYPNIKSIQELKRERGVIEFDGGVILYRLY